MLAFAKYQGLGNDFIIVDLRTESAADVEAAQDPAFVIKACDRQFGIGGDGVLAILPPVSATAHARMRVLNSDGSEAEMCGNGLRCVVRFLYDHGNVKSNPMVIDTGAGALSCELTGDNVVVDMGAPRLLRSEIPMTGAAGERAIAQALAVGGEQLALTCVSMGNPHAVAFVESRAVAEKLARGIGTLVENHAWFPRRTNAEFAAVRASGDIDLIVWERGCGITLACGTGACATAVAACITGRSKLGDTIPVHLLGGTLQIRVEPDYKTVFMAGPAKLVFTGSIDFPTMYASARPSAS